MAIVMSGAGRSRGSLPVASAHGAARTVPVLPLGRHARSASSSTPTTCFDEITDDLLYHGDLNAALRRMLQSGFQDRNGEQRPGHPRDAREAAPEARRDELERYDLGGVYDDIAQELRDVVEMERAGPRRARRRRQQSPATPAARRSPTRSCRSATCSSTCCRPTWPARYASSRSTSSPRPRPARSSSELRRPAAPAAHAELLQPDGRRDERRRPEDMARMKDMLAELNQMLEQRARRRGAATSTGSWSATATSSPRTRRTSTSCSRSMAQRMAAMQAMLNSMTPEQRAQLQGLAEQLLEDMDLRWQVDQLGAEPAAAVPGHGLGPALRLQRPGPARASPRPPR